VTRFVVDAGVVIRLARERAEVPSQHELLAPTLLRSQVLSSLHEAVDRGELTAEEGRELLERTSAIKIRLLGDLVLRRNAWRYADELGEATTYVAEYLALTRLQGDVFVTLDRGLAARAGKVVAIAPFDDLLQG
jgi:indolepyruvate ferredoxin oxidoreductase alpha subunit